MHGNSSGRRQLVRSTSATRSWERTARFPALEGQVFPPRTSRISALLDDYTNAMLSGRDRDGGEFGRTPKGHDRCRILQVAWSRSLGAVQTCSSRCQAQGGAVIGSSDKIGGYPKTDPQRGEHGGDIYQSLGIPSDACGRTRRTDRT